MTALNFLLFRIAVVAIVCLVAGGAIGRFLLAPQEVNVHKTAKEEPNLDAAEAAAKPSTGEGITAATEKQNSEVAQTVFLKWTMVSAFPGDTPQFGTLGRRFIAKLGRASGGTMQIILAEPGNPIKAADCFSAVLEGDAQACWASPGYWASREKSLTLFSGFPFGPDAKEYLAWYYHGGGRELLEEIYRRYGLISVLCGVTASEGGGWFRNELKSAGDFKGMKIRIFGLGARVVEKLGATPLRLRGAEVIKLLRSGQIDGAEYSIPSIDVSLGFHMVAKNYYLPGWHKPAALLEFLINHNAWKDLSNPAKGMILNACGDNIREGLAEGVSLQSAAMRELMEKDVTIRAYPPKLLAAIKAAWSRVAEEESAADLLFSKVWQSLVSFRTEYRLWQDRSYRRRTGQRQ